MEDHEDATLPLILQEERLQTKVNEFKSPNTNKWLSMARKGAFAKKTCIINKTPN